MNEYNISDYSIFDNAISTTNQAQQAVEECATSIIEAKTIISDNSIFMGPICDDCLNGINTLTDELNTLMGNLTTITSYLSTTSSNYQTGDSAASNTVLNLNNQTETATAAAYQSTGTTALSGEKLDFVNSIKDGAVSAYNKYGVLPSLTLAQAILETGWGDSKIGNNIFGIKAGSSWTGKTQNCSTWEQNSDGSTYQTVATFRDYDSISESIEDHAKLLTNDRYKPVLASTNYKDAARTVRECGYATDLEYTNKLINIIETYGLNQWDPVQTT